MNRRGFALLAGLWFLAAVGGIAAWGFTVARLGVVTAGNRVLLFKAEWLREACVELARARYHEWAAGRRFSDGVGDIVTALSLDSVPMGEMGWCTVATEDTGAKVDINLADSTILGCLLGSERPLSKLLSARPIPSVEAFLDILDVNSPTERSLAGQLTVYGTAQVNFNAAPEAVLRCLPGLTPANAAIVVGLRRAGLRLTSLDAVLAALPVHSRDRVLRDYPAFIGVAVMAPPRLLLRATASAWTGRVRSTTLVIAMPGGAELEIIRREAE